MKSIGIIGAMEEEVAILKEKMEDVRIIKKASMDFYEGTLAGRKAVVVRSGIGKVNAGICAQIPALTLPIPERTTTAFLPARVPS